MKNRKKFIASILLVIMIFMTFGGVTVFAGDDDQSNENNAMDSLLKSYSAGTVEESYSKDSSGNVHVVEGNEEIKSKKDYYWAGESIEAKLSSVGYDLLMAGMDIDVSGGKVNGAVRAAGNTVQFTDIKVARNVTIAGKIVRLMNVKFDTGYLAGEKVTFQGTSNCIHAIGNTVVINGVVNGEVTVKAQKVIIGPKADIKGVLKGTASDIQKSETAKINEDQLKEETDNNNNGLLGSLAGGASFLSFAFNLVLWLLICICLHRPVDNAANIMKKRPGILAIIGGITVIGVPVASIALFMTIIGIPITAILMMIYIIMWLISIPFCGAIMGKLILPNMNRWLSSLMGIIILSAISVLPFIGNIIVIAAAMFTMGYFAKSFYENCMKKNTVTNGNITGGGINGNSMNVGSRYPANGYDYSGKNSRDDNGQDKTLNKNDGYQNDNNQNDNTNNINVDNNINDDNNE